MRRTTALLLLLAAFMMAMLVPASTAMACHKGKAHGQQEEVNVELVQDEPLVCGNFL